VVKYWGFKFSGQSASDYRKPMLLVACILEQYALHPENQISKYKILVSVTSYKISISSENKMTTGKVIA
jgi:hypothetical protein